MKNTVIYHTGRFLLYFFSIGVAVVSLRYWSLEVTGLLHTKEPQVLTNWLFRLAFYGHVFFSPVALLVGPFQFSSKIRLQWLALHRFSGKVYVVACLCGGLAGLLAAQFATGGWISRVGFSCLAVCWLFTTANAWTAIRQKQVEKHRRWMVLSFALTLAAVTLRIYLPVMQAVLGFDFFTAYRVVSWLCWVPNLVVATLWTGKK